MPTSWDASHQDIAPAEIRHVVRYSKADYLYYEFYEQGGKQSIYKNGWKLVRLNINKPAKIVEELYYLPKDKCERKNLLLQYPEKAQELKQLMSEAHTDSDQYSWNTNQ